MTFHARHLPHWQPPDRAVFITWRLSGSLPVDVIDRLEKDHKLPAGRRFLEIDKALDDRATTDAKWLRDHRIAEAVIAALRKGQDELELFALHAYVIMPNHVHLLLNPSASVSRITKGIKGVTARQSNAILGRTGETFWQDESFDHWVRDSAKFAQIATYIENNPVAAGLSKTPQAWPWSSASRTDILVCPPPNPRYKMNQPEEDCDF